jgi:hypothetical protein
MLSAAAVVITSAMIVGQTQPTDQIKALGWMVGDWKAVDETAAEDMAGVAAKGDKISVRLSWDWILDKAKLRWDLEVKGPSGAIKGMAIMGQDNEGKLKHWWFDTNAFRTPDVAEWSNDGDTWTFRSTSLDSAWVLTKVSNDSMTIALVRRDGEDVATPKPLKYERVSRE